MPKVPETKVKNKGIILSKKGKNSINISRKREILSKIVLEI